MPDHDVVIIGAGHNGLTAASLLARAGVDVLCIEKNRYVGGMASTVELFDGYHFEIAGSVIFPIAPYVVADLDLENCGLQPIRREIMATNIGDPGEPALHMYSDPMRMLQHLAQDHGPDAAEGFAQPRAVRSGTGARARSLQPVQSAAHARPGLRRREDGRGAQCAAALLLRQRDGRRRQVLPGSQPPQDPAHHARVPRGELDVPRPLHARQRDVPRLRARRAGERLGDAQAEGRHRLAREGARARRSRSAAGSCASTSRSSGSCVENGRAVGVELAGGERDHRAQGRLQPRSHARRSAG